MQHTHPFATLRHGELLVMHTPGRLPSADRRLSSLTRLLPGFAVRMAETANPNRGTVVMALRPSVVPGMRPTYVSTVLESLDSRQAYEFVKALRNVLDPAVGDDVIGHVRTYDDYASDDYASPCYAEISHSCCHLSAVSDKEPDRGTDSGLTAPDDLDEQRKEWIDRLSALVLEYVAIHHELPPMQKVEEILRGKIAVTPNGLSPVNVSGDLRVFLPAYNEIELRFAPLPRALYILFLKHPEGIVLKQIAEYRDELDEIYSMVMPGRDERMARAMICDLTTPGSDSLRQKLSQIKACVMRYIVDRERAERYCVSGERGKPYGVDIPAGLIHLPAVLR